MKLLFTFIQQKHFCLFFSIFCFVFHIIMAHFLRGKISIITSFIFSSFDVAFDYLVFLSFMALKLFCFLICFFFIFIKNSIIAMYSQDCYCQCLSKWYHKLQYPRQHPALVQSSQPEIVNKQLSNWLIHCLQFYKGCFEAQRSTVLPKGLQFFLEIYNSP